MNLEMLVSAEIKMLEAISLWATQQSFLNMLMSKDICKVFGFFIFSFIYI